MHKHPFYGKEICRDEQHEHIKTLLDKYRCEKVTTSLQERVYNELALLKAEGKISIPFKVLLKKDPSNTYHAYIEVLLDTKV